MNMPLTRPRPSRDSSQSCVTFSPLAWLKLQYLCHAGDTEVGGFGIAAEDDLLYIEDFFTVRQEVSPVSVCFNDMAVADFFDQCVDKGLSVQCFSRLWLHTHPGDSVIPSWVDEQTFHRCFGRCDWAVMFILGRTGKTYARLTYNTGPCASVLLPTSVNWSAWPYLLNETDDPLQEHFERWQKEYVDNIHPLPELLPVKQLISGQPDQKLEWWEGLPWRHESDGVLYEIGGEGGIE